MMLDLEICKRIAEIEGLEVASPREASSREYNPDVCVILPYGEHDGGSYSYNPLEDDALCFRLMVKYKLFVSEGLTGERGREYAVDTGSSVIFSDNPNKAICLAIIESQEN